MEVTLPKEFYYWIGVVAVLLLGQIGFIAGILFKAGKFVARCEQTDRKTDLAHKRIDKHSEEIKIMNKTIGGFK